MVKGHAHAYEQTPLSLSISVRVHVCVRVCLCVCICVYTSVESTTVRQRAASRRRRKEERRMHLWSKEKEKENRSRRAHTHTHMQMHMDARTSVYGCARNNKAKKKREEEKRVEAISPVRPNRCLFSCSSILLTTGTYTYTLQTSVSQPYLRACVSMCVCRLSWGQGRSGGASGNGGRTHSYTHMYWGARWRSSPPPPRRAKSIERKASDLSEEGAESISTQKNRRSKGEGEKEKGTANWPMR